MSNHHSPKNRKPTSLPLISPGVVGRYQNAKTDFERLFTVLKESNPVLARWLLEATEEIAPGNVADKERYAMLALALFNMFQEQTLVNRLDDVYQESFEAPSDISVALELSVDGDLIDPEP